MTNFLFILLQFVVIRFLIYRVLCHLKPKKGEESHYYQQVKAIT